MMLGKVCLMTKLSTKEASAPRTATAVERNTIIPGPKRRLHRRLGPVVWVHSKTCEQI